MPYRDWQNTRTSPRHTKIVYVLENSRNWLPCQLARWTGGARLTHPLLLPAYKSAKSYCRSDSRWGAYTSGCCGTSPRALDQHPSRFPATAPHFRAVGAQPCAEALNICSFASRLLICFLAEQIRYIRDREFLMLQTSTLLWNITQKGLPAT